jgi:hypothetical protein
MSYALSDGRAWTVGKHLSKLISLTVLVFAFLVSAQSGWAQNDKHRQSPDDMGFPDLVSGLKSVKGCLGVETAQTASKKNIIFAWFENKQAVLNWYYHDMHQGVMKAFFSDGPSRKPMQDVPDDMGPIMAIASITFSDKAHFEETDLPISQIAIELYTPVTGGIFLGGRFAPDAVKVNNMKDYTPTENQK